MGIQSKGRYTHGNKTKAQITNLTGVGLARTGTLVSSGTAITGTGTLFLTELLVGDIIECSGETLEITVITDNTNMTASSSAITDFATESYTLLNPNRIKAGESVFNVTDRIAMYYTGDGRNLWTKGEFCSGQAIPIRNAWGDASITEGEVLEPSSTVNYGLVDYDGTLDHACAVNYALVKARCCMAVGVVGMHNTDSSGTITKGDACQPHSSTSAVISDGTSMSADNCGIAMTSDGTPTSGELEMMVNFLERL
jgi:hypothetical protein